MSGLQLPSNVSFICLRVLILRFLFEFKPDYLLSATAAHEIDMI